MLSCHSFWFLLCFMIFAENHSSVVKPLNDTTEASKTISSHFELITDDVIHDNVEQDIKKVIRVNPLDLPPLQDDPNVLNMDSSLYKIQSLKPYNGKRKYVNMQRNKPFKDLTDATIIRRITTLPSPDKTSKPKHQPKKKNLHFLYNQEDPTGKLWSKSMRVHVAPGAYPVYYVIAKTNGRFGKYPLKSFSSAREFMKYLQKNKMENVPILETQSEEVSVI